MSGFLLDTNVISMLSPLRADASALFVDWLERVDGEGRVFLSVVAIHEIEKGIALLEHKGATAKAAGLRVWLAGLLATYDDKSCPSTPPPLRFPVSWRLSRLRRGMIRVWRTPRWPVLQRCGTW